MTKIKTKKQENDKNKNKKKQENEKNKNEKR